MTKCRCGCGATVRHWFIAGHDSKLWARCLADNGGDYVEATACYVAIRDGV
jgi:hypothetical protein